MSEQIEKLQEKINTTYYQKFTINNDLSIIPGSTAQVNIDYMEQYFLNDKIVGKTVLDIGCSHGLFSVLAAQIGAKVVGIDPYEPAIEIAKELSSMLDLKIEYKKRKFDADIVKWRKFDYIICCSVYHYMYGTLKSHNEIFKILYATGADVFFEDGTGIDDPCTKQYLEREIPAEIPNYNNVNIMLAASNYFDIQYLGKHENGTRLIYWLKRKPQKNPNKYESVYTIFQNTNTGVFVDKVEKNEQFFCKKHIVGTNMLPFSTVKESYENRITKLNIPEMVKIVETIYNENPEYLDLIMEFLPEYTPIPDLYIPLTTKRNLYMLMIKTYYDMIEQGFVIWDFGPGNFMMNAQSDIKMIDFDALLPFSETMNPIHENFYYCFFLYHTRMLKWLFTEDCR